eukprot:6183857-Pleurochrysis_carterae.AAC.3
MSACTGCDCAGLAAPLVSARAPPTAGSSACAGRPPCLSRMLRGFCRIAPRRARLPADLVLVPAAQDDRASFPASRSDGGVLCLFPAAAARAAVGGEIVSNSLPDNNGFHHDSSRESTL